MIYDRLENAPTYFSNEAWTKEAWSKAVEYVRAAPADLADGVYPILGEDVVARVMSYYSKHFQETVLESHQKFVDLQVLLAGREFAEVSTSAELHERTPYSAEKDVAFYFPDPLASYCRMTLEPGRFAVFFPQDAHRTQLRIGGAAEYVKKVVVKIALRLLTPN